MRENHILIIDDDLMLLKTAEEILSDQYNVSVAKSGIQALNLLNKNIIPDLILLDIDMPQMDGYETLEEIKKIPRCELIPIIFLTGFSEMDYEVRGLKAGAVDYIVKPFAKEILLARVERHLERYQQRQHKKSMELSDYAVNTNRMEDCNSDCRRNGKQGNCRVYALFLWVREKSCGKDLLKIRD